MGAVTHQGGWPLETAFVISVLIAAATTFRALEVFTRSADAEALAALPLRGAAFAIDRGALVARDSVRLGALGASFIAPALARPGGGIALFAVTYGALAAVVSALLGSAMVAHALIAAADPRSVAARLVGVSVRRTAATLQLAPGIAFATVCGALLLMKLGLEQPCADWWAGRPFAPTRADLLAVALPAAAAATMFGSACLGLDRSLAQVQAAYRDVADVEPYVGYSPFAAQGSGRQAATPRPRVALLAAKDLAQLQRSAPFLRVGSWVVATVSVAVLLIGPSTFGPTAVGAAGALWLALAVDPVRRARDLPGEEVFGAGELLASAGERAAARGIAAAREILVHALPLLVAAAAAGPRWWEVVAPPAAVAAATVWAAPAYPVPVVTLATASAAVATLAASALHPVAGLVPASLLLLAASIARRPVRLPA